MLCIGALTAEAAPYGEPATITVAITIVDGATAQPLIGSVMVEGQAVAQAISAGQVAMPADMSLHIVCVEAVG